MKREPSANFEIMFYYFYNDGVIIKAVDHIFNVTIMSSTETYLIQNRNQKYQISSYFQ